MPFLYYFIIAIGILIIYTVFKPKQKQELQEQETYDPVVYYNGFTAGEKRKRQGAIASFRGSGSLQCLQGVCFDGVEFNALMNEKKIEFYKLLLHTDDTIKLSSGKKSQSMAQIELTDTPTAPKYATDVVYQDFKFSIPAQKYATDKPTLWHTTSDLVCTLNINTKPFNPVTPITLNDSFSFMQNTEKCPWLHDNYHRTLAHHKVEIPRKKDVYVKVEDGFLRASQLLIYYGYHQIDHGILDNFFL